MQLDERKWKILQAIIKTYLETGEPVGSRTISKYADLNLSSATIRMKWQIWKSLDTSSSRILQPAGFLQTLVIVCM